MSKYNVFFVQNMHCCTMRLVFLLLLYPVEIIAPKTEKIDLYAEFSLRKRNILVNILIDKLIAYIRYIMIHGSAVVGIPPLDPFEMEDFHLIVPTGLFNFDIKFQNVSVIGIGGFKMHRNNLHLSNLTFEIEVSVPRVIMSAKIMHLSELDNDFTKSIPLYDKDNIELEMDNFRFQSVLLLKQSDDERSILIDKIEDALFDLPSLKMNLDGVIDEDNLESLSTIENGIIEYVNSCKDTITRVVSNAIITFGNPVLNRLDTWRYINILLS